MPHILVTGGAGFIGSHTVEELLDAGADVTVLDNLSSGKMSNIESVRDRIRFLHGEICDQATIAESLEGVDAVIHLAAQPSVELSKSQPLQTHTSNYVGTLTLLEAMREKSIRRVVYASTAAVYRAEHEEPHCETDMPDPSTPYGVDKLAGEFLLRSYQKLYGIESTCLRFFNIFGERQDSSSPYAGVISIFVDRIFSSMPLTVYGDGNQTRDFVYIGDLAALLSSTVLGDVEVPCLMNVGTGRRNSVNQLIDALCDVMHAKPEVIYAARRTGDVIHSRADVSRLLASYGPMQTDLKSGLGNLVKSLER